MRAPGKALECHTQTHSRVLTPACCWPVDLAAHRALLNERYGLVNGLGWPSLSVAHHVVTSVWSIWVFILLYVWEHVFSMTVSRQYCVSLLLYLTALILSMHLKEWTSLPYHLVSNKLRWGIKHTYLIILLSKFFYTFVRKNQASDLQISVKGMIFFRVVPAYRKERINIPSTPWLALYQYSTNTVSATLPQLWLR